MYFDIYVVLLSLRYDCYLKKRAVRTNLDIYVLAHNKLVILLEAHRTYYFFR
jgi:hypothetical protein